jgi:glutamine amidotransferase
VTTSTAIIDYGTGNLRSIWRALNRSGVAAEVVSDPRSVAAADRIVLPGVGNFARAMSSLRRSSLIEPLHQAAFERRIPILGICLGLELMASSSEEGRSAGLGWLDARVVRFRPEDQERHKVPYIGWNSVNKKLDSKLLADLNGASEFYFLHSYHLEMADKNAVAAETTYETAFPSVIEKENLFGVQFHPERSHESGRRLLMNFLNI